MFKKTKAQPVEGSPKEALAAYILYLEEKEYSWYDNASTPNFWAWSIAQGAVVCASLFTAGIAALAKEDTFKTYGLLRILLIVVPLAGAFASSVLLQTRIRDLFALREKGRQTVRTLIDLGRAEFAAASSPERYTTIHRDLAAKMDRIDKEQTIGFFDVVPEIKSQGSS